MHGADGTFYRGEVPKRPPSRTEWTRRVPQPVLIGRGVSDYPGAHAGRRVQVHFPVRDGRRSGDAYVELEGEAEVYAP